jgi:hypothetical protein
MGKETRERVRRQRAAALRVANAILRDHPQTLSRDQIANLLAEAYLQGKKNGR